MQIKHQSKGQPMTAELAEKLAEIEERLKKAQQELYGLCDGSRRFTMSVPVEKSDTDVTICASFDDISTLIKAVRERGWQPIETAPKEGRILLLMGGSTVIGYWDTQRYHSNPKPYWASDRSCASVIRDRSTPPTHWMPLPQPPLTPNGKE